MESKITRKDFVFYVRGISILIVLSMFTASACLPAYYSGNEVMPGLMMFLCSPFAILGFPISFMENPLSIVPSTELSALANLFLPMWLLFSTLCLSDEFNENKKSIRVLEALLCLLATLSFLVAFQFSFLTVTSITGVWTISKLGSGYNMWCGSNLVATVASFVVLCTKLYPTATAQREPRVKGLLEQICELEKPVGLSCQLMSENDMP